MTTLHISKKELRDELVPIVKTFLHENYPNTLQYSDPIITRETSPGDYNKAAISWTGTDWAYDFVDWYYDVDKPHRPYEVDIINSYEINVTRDPHA